MEMLAGVVGVPLLIAVAYTWCWLEERSKARAKRKYDQQMAKYDTWKKHIDSM
jgi:hypothetical protein